MRQTDASCRLVAIGVPMLQAICVMFAANRVLMIPDDNDAVPLLTSNIDHKVVQPRRNMDMAAVLQVIRMSRSRHQTHPTHLIRSFFSPMCMLPSAAAVQFSLGQFSSHQVHYCKLRLPISCQH